jgi:hypothetical protein
VTSQGHGRIVAGSRQGDGMGTACERHVGDLPAFVVFLLPRGVPGSFLLEACQSQMQVVSVKQTTFVMDEEKLIIFLQGHEFLYKLQHSDYGNTLVKDNCWKEIAGEWQGRDRVVAAERHVMCESGLRSQKSEVLIYTAVQPKLTQSMV